MIFSIKRTASSSFDGKASNENDDKYARNKQTRKEYTGNVRVYNEES